MIVQVGRRRSRAAPLMDIDGVELAANYGTTPYPTDLRRPRAAVKRLSRDRDSPVAHQSLASYLTPTLDVNRSDVS